MKSAILRSVFPKSEIGNFLSDRLGKAVMMGMMRLAALVPAFSWDDTTILRPWFTGSKLKIYYKI